MRVPPLIIIPQNDLDEVRAQLNPRARAKDGRSGVADEIGGDDLVLRVLDNAFARTFSGSFHGGFDLFEGRGFLDADDKSTTDTSRVGTRNARPLYRREKSEVSDGKTRQRE